MHVFSKNLSSFTCRPTRSSTNGMSHACLCLPPTYWYSFTPKRWKAEGLDGWLCSQAVSLPEDSHPSHY